jgi:methylenetetrahydrofolate reductase (NADPH)
MSAVNAVGEPSRTPLERLLEAPRFEVIPVKGIEDRVAALAPGATVTVTASPAHGIGRTVEVSERLAAAGYAVVPHLAARMLRDKDELAGAVERLRAAGVVEAFVVGGDASPPAGEFYDAAGLLEALAELPDRFPRMGVGGYPEGHPKIPADQLRQALLGKQDFADYVATQICFDAGALEDWIVAMREAGLHLPVVVGLPGVVDRRKLAEISLQTGVGQSVRYLFKHARQVAALVRSSRYDPGPLARAVAARSDRPGLDIRGVHLFTFNQVEATDAWVRGVAAAAA